MPPAAPSVFYPGSLDVTELSNTAPCLPRQFVLGSSSLNEGGSGAFQIASAGYGDGVRAIDPRDGKVLWSLPAPVPTCARAVAVDIDGRKGDALLYVAGSKLIAITGDRSSGRILWEWQGPADLSMPTIADLNGDGLAEIIVQAADGSVHCVDDGSSPR